MLLAYKNLFYLVCIDLRVFFKTLSKRLIDTAFWISSRVVVFVFLFPVIGAPVEFVGIFFAGALFTAGMFEFTGTVSSFIGNVEKQGSITYQLSIPVPQYFVLIKILIAHTVRAITLSVMALCLAKLMMWSAFDLSQVSWVRIIVALFITCAFSGCFTLFCAARIYDVSDISFVWRSWVHPLFLLGGNMFPWRALAAAFPRLSLFFLLNPFMLATEAVRSALLGPVGYLPFWSSILSLVAISLLLGGFGLYRFKSRLDLL